MTTEAQNNQVSITIPHKHEEQTLCPEKVTEEVSFQSLMFSEGVKRSTRFFILLICIVFLIIGRYSVPDIEITNVKDYVMDFFKFSNDFINEQGNELYRNSLQFACSFLVDIVFIITFGYWVLRGTNARLPLSLGVFYITRAIVQKLWISPYPEGFYWESPGIPSLVVPYGRGSDFFFSGHSGFLVICACEWNKIKMTRVRNFVIAVLVYTAFILLTFRIHYSIDIFTGIFFSEWCFGKIDLCIADIERIPRKVVQFFQNRFYFNKNVKDLNLNQPNQDQEEEQKEESP